MYKNVLIIAITMDCVCISCVIVDKDIMGSIVNIMIIYRSQMDWII